LILAESSLSFLGLGVQAPDDSWGLIVAQGRAYVRTAWWVVAFSGSAIFATALAIGIVAESVAEAADPLRCREGRRSW
jgi:peptide/nickel transport system permease protein